MTDYLWTTNDLLAATNGRPVGDLPEGVTGISIDSRSLKPGEVFFAITGDMLDGHEYLGAAAKAGAACAFVAASKLVALGGMSLPLIVVRDVLEAMELLGQASRMRSKAQIVAVTGSVGKTSTKEMLRQVLSASGEVHASAASFNNHWGVPLTLARMPETTRFGVFEIGMNHPDEITPLVNMVRPHVSLITNVAAAHLGAFANVNEIAKAKAEIFSGVIPGGYAILPKDDQRFKILNQYVEESSVDKTYSFGTKRGSDVWIKDADYLPEQSHFTVQIKGKNYKCVLSVAGRHMVLNAAAVLAVSMLLGADMEKSIAALSTIEPEKGRGQRHVVGDPKKPLTIIDETYNANPRSMEAALEMLGSSEPSKGGRRIAVLGDMLELGSHSKRLHQALIDPLDEAEVDLVLLVGKEMIHLRDNLDKWRIAGYFDKASDMQSVLMKTVKAGDVVMLKASNGLKFAPLVDVLVDAFGKNKKR